MNRQKSWLSCREAGELLNFTQRHVLNLIKKGRIKAEKDEDGRYIIMKSDFYIQYPELMNAEMDSNEEKPSSNELVRMLEERVRHLQEMVEEKKKQNEFLTEQLSNFTQEKMKMLEAINGHTRLLEFKETSKIDGLSAATKEAHKSYSWLPFKKR